MSMSLRFHTVSDFDINDITEEPKRLEILHYGEILDPSSLDDLNETEKDIIQKWTPKTKSEVFYVEGMFQSLHYLLTFQTESNQGSFPLNFLTGERNEIGEIGWGAATFYNSDDVQLIATALNNLDYSEIEKRYNADFFNENKIYPSGYTWTPNDAGTLIERLKEITEFINETNRKHLGIYRVLV
jgi:hypothetical protein